MAKFVRTEQCPRCAENCRDNHRDNLGVYSDGSSFCFSCGFVNKSSVRHVFKEREKVDDNEKAVLPSDYTGDIPGRAWKWLLKYQLGIDYWKGRCGYSPSQERLVFPMGTPTRFSVGRLIEGEGTKWRIWGDKTNCVETVGDGLSGPIVLVEDIISAHKVGQVATSICLFGTAISDHIIKELKRFNRPVLLWLDEDQYQHLPKKIGRLQSLLGPSVGYIMTRKDPKEYSTKEIHEILYKE